MALVPSYPGTGILKLSVLLAQSELLFLTQLPFFSHSDALHFRSSCLIVLGMLHVFSSVCCSSPASGCLKNAGQYGDICILISSRCESGMMQYHRVMALTPTHDLTSLKSPLTCLVPHQASPIVHRQAVFTQHNRTWQARVGWCQKQNRPM